MFKLPQDENIRTINKKGETMKFSLFIIAAIMTTIFASLKLANVIAWSWWLVFTPLLVWLGLVVAILILALLIALIAAVALSKS